jgi:gliding motility-associated protein GldM
MAGGKETPRQRMMGILYLVLLGLVALSVPDSLMDAFKNIRKSMDTSTENVNKGIQTTFSTFEATKLKEEKDRATPILQRARDAQAASDELDKYVEQLKAALIQKGDGIDPKTEDVGARENLDITPHMFITDKKGEELRAKIDQTREKLLSFLTAKEKEGINLPLNTDPPKQVPGSGVKKNWEEAYFGDGIPLGATLTTLSKIKADNKNSENEVVKKILGRLDQALVTLDQFQGVAVAPTSYILQGQPYSADIFLTAYDSKSNPKITINGSSIPVNDGKGKYTVSTSKEGIFTYTGDIVVKGPDGDKHYPLPTQTYQVSKPSAVVSPDKMNVLYIGLPNPVSVSAPGISKENLRVSMTGGTITGSGDHWTANVSSIGEATISVSGIAGTNKTPVTLGSSVFRVKRIPDPKATFAGKSGGTTSAANIRAQDRLFAKLDNFEFDAKFNVTRFTMLVAKPRQDVISYSATGNELTPQMKALIGSVSPGTTIVFKDIIAVGPDGTQRGLDGIVFSAN